MEEQDKQQRREYYVTPRHLAGEAPGSGDRGFAPVGHWPHHELTAGPCPLVITSPDHRITIGWFDDDDYRPWRISAAEDVVSAPDWTATFSCDVPPKVVESFTSSLAHDWDSGSDRFLGQLPVHSESNLAPLTEAGWTHRPVPHGTVKLLSPNQHIELRIATTDHGRNSKNVLL